jgi:hypothetical protein
MGERKMTAVEWLEKALKLENYPKDGHMQKCIKKAKQMEKKQIIEAYKQGQHDSDPRETDAEDYYNETYKSE